MIPWRTLFFIKGVDENPYKSDNQAIQTFTHNQNQILRHILIKFGLLFNPYTKFKVRTVLAFVLIVGNNAKCWRGDPWPTAKEKYTVKAIWHQQPTNLDLVSKKKSLVLLRFLENYKLRVQANASRNGNNSKCSLESQTRTCKWTMTSFPPRMFRGFPLKKLPACMQLFALHATANLSNVQMQRALAI